MGTNSLNINKSISSPESADFLSDFVGQECPQTSRSLPEDSPANHSVTLEDEKVRQTIVISGQKCFESFLKSSQPTSSQKTFVDLFLSISEGISIRFTPTWREKATKHSHRLFFQLVPSVPRTGETGVGFWPTVDTTNGAPNKNSNKKNGPKSLIQVAREMWPTPTSRDYKDGSAEACKNVPVNALLGRAVHHPEMYPTPQARDHMPAHSEKYISEKMSEGHGMRNLNDFVLFPYLYATPQSRDYRTGQASRWENPDRSRNLNGQIGGLLNPMWVEWLMGYPLGWTDLSASETPSSHKSQSISREESSPSTNFVQKPNNNWLEDFVQ